MSREKEKARIQAQITELLAMVDPIDGQRHEAFNIIYDLLRDCGSEKFVDEVLAWISKSDVLDDDSLTGYPY